MYKKFAMGVVAAAFLVALFIDDFMPPEPPPANDTNSQGPAEVQVNENAAFESAPPPISSHDDASSGDGFGEPTDSGLPLFDTTGAAEDDDFGDLQVEPLAPEGVSGPADNRGINAEEEIKREPGTDGIKPPLDLG